jgi:hypothetical protein
VYTSTPGYRPIMVVQSQPGPTESTAYSGPAARSYLPTAKRE